MFSKEIARAGNGWNGSFKMDMLWHGSGIYYCMACNLVCTGRLGFKGRCTILTGSQHRRSGNFAGLTWEMVDGIQGKATGTIRRHI